MGNKYGLIILYIKFTDQLCLFHYQNGSKWIES